MHYFLPSILESAMHKAQHCTTSEKRRRCISYLRAFLFLWGVCFPYHYARTFTSSLYFFLSDQMLYSVNTRCSLTTVNLVYGTLFVYCVLKSEILNFNNKKVIFLSLQYSRKLSESLKRCTSIKMK